MTTRALAAIALTGCNAVFGLHEPQGAVDGGGVDSAAPTAAGAIHAASHDYLDVNGTAIVTYRLDAELGPATWTCDEHLRVGGCATATCRPSDRVARPAAGLVTFTAALTDTLAPEADGNYLPRTATGRLFLPDTSLHVAAIGGADVPGFDAQVTTPSSVTFTTFVPSPGGAMAIYERDDDLDLTWDGGTVGHVVITITASSGVSVLCAFPASGGGGVVHHTLLQELPLGPGRFAAAVWSSTLIAAGTYSVQVTASVVGKTDAGDWAAGDVLLE